MDDDDQYDEFGNYIGPDIDSHSEEAEEEAKVEDPPEGV